MIYTNLFPGGRTKALTLSYDDGVKEDIRLMDILRKCGMKATFNINASRTAPESVKNDYTGFEVAVHGYSHPFLQMMPSDMMAREIALDRATLEEQTGYPVRGMAYPYGTYNQKVIEQLRALGIVYSRTVVSTHAFHLPEDFLEWHPTCHHDDPELWNLCDRFLADKSRDPHKVFYLWGHSFEFDRKNNWERIEQFCEKMSGHEDIWYATNMEIYEYIDASRRLVTSCDGKIVYNPSAVDVWVSNNARWNYNGDKVCIPAGQIVNLSK